MHEDPDTGFVAVSAFRYACGRCSVAPGIVSGWLLRHWLDLPESDREIILRDLRKWVSLDDEARLMGSPHAVLGDDCDREVWLRFLRDAEGGK